MSGWLAAGLLAALALGMLTVGWRSWPGRGSVRGALVVPLAAGVGLGLSSCVFVVWLWMGGSATAFPLAEAVLVVALGALVLSRGHSGPALRPEPLPVQAPHTSRLLLILLAGCAAAAGAAFVGEAAAHPHGSWDAWMTWNMHARVLVRGGDHWGELLAALPGWSHPDYPLLVPAAVARIWTYLGKEHPLGPIVIGFVFTFGTVVLLCAGLSMLRSPSQGLLAALLLLGTKFFILHGASQYADIPLGFFILATLMLLVLGERSSRLRHRILVLAGVTAGLAAWTKNEGFLFLIATGVVYGYALARTRGVAAAAKEGRSVALGLAPVLAIVLAFKSWVGAPSDLMADQGLVQSAARLLDGPRYPQVAGGFIAAVLEVGSRGLVPLLLAVYAVVAGLASAAADRRSGAAVGSVVSLMLAGYALVLLVAPAPRLETNIRSINRLLLQLWPSMLFAYFLVVRTAEEARRTGWRASTPLEPA
jgi:hypothetical protein